MRPHVTREKAVKSKIMRKTWNCCKITINRNKYHKLFAKWPSIALNRNKCSKKATLCWNLPQIAKRNNKVWKLFGNLPLFPWWHGASEEIWTEEKMTCRNDSDDSARLHIGRQISYGFRCFQLRSSKWDSLPAHVLFDQFDWGFHFWIVRLSVCRSVNQPVCLPACLPACVCFFF